MKKTLSILLSAAMLLSCPAVSAYAAKNEIQPTYEEKQVKVSPLPGKGENMEFTCLFRDDLPEIPFVNVEDYFSQVFSMDQEFSAFGNGVFKFPNGDYLMTVDAEKDTISFDLLEGYLTSNLQDGFFPVYPFIESTDGFEFVGEVKGVELDLSKYYLDIVEKDCSVYLPFCVLNDLFLETGTVMRYKNEKLIMSMSMNLMGAKGVFGDTRSKEFAQFSYDELCFAIDCCCGRPSNALLTNSIIDGGLDNALDTYNSITPRIKEMLLSENIDEYCLGLELLQVYLDDGGHTSLVYSIADRLAYLGVTDVESLVNKVFGDEKNDDIAQILAYGESEKIFRDKMNSLVASKSDAYKTFETIKQWQGAALFRKGDTYIFNFDAFGASVVKPFKEALDYAKANGAKNFILDVTTNGGGDDTIAAYMVSLMADSHSYLEKYVVSNNVMRLDQRMDKNLDGKFDEKDDEVKYDFRFGVISAKGSYSCANIFPCMAQDHGICLIGEKTAGGSCAVMPRLFTNGTGYNASGFMMYLREEGKDPDAGAEPDIPMPGEEENYKGFFDINAINKGMAEFYGDPIPQTNSVYGDIDGDGKVSAKDSLLIQRYVINMVKFDDTQMKAADVNCDDKITAKDALEIQRYSIGYRNADSRVNQAV